MRLERKIFDSYGELVNFVNNEEIKKENIQAICLIDYCRCVLFYWK